MKRHDFFPPIVRVLILLLLTLVLVLPVLAAELDVASDASSAALPLWAEKGSTLTFKVSGTWTMWDQWGPVGAEGHRSFKKVGGFYLGTLLGCIEGGSPFAISDGMTYSCRESGLLSIYPNRGDYTNLKTGGSMHVTINGTKECSRQEADRLYGFDPALWTSALQAAWLSPEEQSTLVLLNQARTNPPLFARLYLAQASSQSDAAMECWKELLAATPLPALAASKALSLAARDHAKDMGSNGMSGHVSSTGQTLDARIKRYGTWEYTIGENCSYGYADAKGIILQLLIDDGVPSRGHRENIMSRDFARAGISIQPHRTYQFNCVMDFAGSIKD